MTASPIERKHLSPMALFDSLRELHLSPAQLQAVAEVERDAKREWLSRHGDVSEATSDDQETVSSISSARRERLNADIESNEWQSLSMLTDEPEWLAALYDHIQREPASAIRNRGQASRRFMRLEAGPLADSGYKPYVDLKVEVSVESATSAPPSNVAKITVLLHPDEITSAVNRPRIQLALITPDGQMLSAKTSVDGLAEFASVPISAYSPSDLGLQWRRISDQTEPNFD